MKTIQRSDLEIAITEIAKEFGVTDQELIEMTIEKKSIAESVEGNTSPKGT